MKKYIAKSDKKKINTASIEEQLYDSSNRRCRY